LPAASNSYKCPSGTCSYTASQFLGQKLYLYDNRSWNAAPITGTLTTERSMLRWNDSTNYTDPRYADVAYSYDAWGNRTSVTQYTGEGTGSALAATGAQTDTTAYDTTYRTYALSETRQPINQTTSWTYNYALGLPISETGPNGSATTISAANAAPNMMGLAARGK
jgi:YD repeat-containing protein